MPSEAGWVCSDHRWLARWGPGRSAQAAPYGEAGIDLGAIGFDAIKHLVLCRAERVPPRLDLDVYPFLPRTKVEKTFARAYMSLLSDGQKAA